MKRFLCPIAFLVLFTLGLAACHSDSTGPNNGKDTIVIRDTVIIKVDSSGSKGKALISPKVGSSFMFRYVYIDSIGGIIDTLGPDGHGGDIVLATGITQYGKTNVTQFTGNFYYQFVNYESNGDISYYREASSPGETGKWITVPLASKGIAASVEPDTLYSIWYTYTGIKSMTVNGYNFNVESFDEYNGYTKDGIKSVDFIDRYDAATGMSVLQDFPSSRYNGTYVDGARFEITSFQLK